MSELEKNSPSIKLLVGNKTDDKVAHARLFVLPFLFVVEHHCTRMLSGWARNAMLIIASDNERSEHGSIASLNCFVCFQDGSFREVSVADGNKLAEDMNMIYYETR